MFLEAFAAFVDLAACATSEGLSSGNVHVYHGIGAVFGVESLLNLFFKIPNSPPFMLYWKKIGN
jgi:hypothetical protein